MLSALSPMQRSIVRYFRVSMAVKTIAIVGLLILLHSRGVI